MQGSPGQVYAARAEAFRLEALGFTVRFNRFANLRLAAFVASAACLIWGVSQSSPVAVGAGLVLALALAAFVVLVRYHRFLGSSRDRATALHQINVEAVERLRRRWQNVPLRHTLQADRLHPYAADLDLFGHASLLHLLDTTRTSMGQATLARWLLNGADPSTIRERQGGVADLAPQLDFRQELEVRGALEGATRPDPEPLLAWAESAPWLLRRRGLLWAARLSPVLLCGLGLAQATGLLPWPVWLPFLLINLFLWQLLGNQAYATLSRISTLEGAFRQYAASFDLLSTTDVRGAAAQTAAARTLTTDGRSAYAQMRHLERLTRLVLPRSAQVYWVVQAILLWDVHVLAALEGWQARIGPRARVWLETLGEIEALAALAGLAHAHPDWAMPEIDETACQLEAQQAGHPLLRPTYAVDNDVALGPPGTFLLVTGSNMAGKSTFLRTLGTNIVLAQAGGPVCARAFRMPPLALCTSMRVVDSLERGVSTFLAEVLRLKQVVDSARADDGRSHALLPARRDPPGHQHRRAPDRRAASDPLLARARRDRRGLDARPDPGRRPGPRRRGPPRPLQRNAHRRPRRPRHDVRLSPPPRPGHVVERLAPGRAVGAELRSGRWGGLSASLAVSCTARPGPRPSYGPPPLLSAWTILPRLFLGLPVSSPRQIPAMTE